MERGTGDSNDIGRMYRAILKLKVRIEGYIPRVVRASFGVVWRFLPDDWSPHEFPTCASLRNFVGYVALQFLLKGSLVSLHFIEPVGNKRQTENLLEYVEGHLREWKIR